MKVGIMQPYFFPYAGYFQLIQATDVFVVYDNIEYTKKGWINRNRISGRQGDKTITLPIAAASDTLMIRDREIATAFQVNKLLNKLRETYRKAPHFESAFNLVTDIISQGQKNLFEYLFTQLTEICAFLELDAELKVSSSIDADHALKKEERVLSICSALGATRYINAIGGVELYSEQRFEEAGIELRFLRSNIKPYAQFSPEFVPHLSIIDLLMFNSVEVIKKKLTSEFELIKS